MFPEFLVPETVATKDGAGQPVALGGQQGKILRLTLGITSIVEQESIDVAIHGSTDGQTFDPKPLATFPQKFYCGTYALLIDLEDKPEISHLRVQWKMNRWGRGSLTPMFGFYVFAQASSLQAVGAGR
jgi:hypothetical protein